MSIFVDNKAVPSAPQKIEIGSLALRLDSNNDTEIDDKGTSLDAQDDAAARAGKPWAFWEGDPAKTGTLDELADWATVRLRANALPSPGVKVSLVAFGADWSLAPKANPGKMYLSGDPDQDAPARQLQALQAFAARSSGVKGEIPIPLEWLRKGENAFLVKFRRAPTSGVAGLDPTIDIDIVPNVAAPNTVALGDSAKVEVRPVKGWMSAMTARSTGVSNAPSQNSPRPRLAPLAGWEVVPEQTGRVTLLLHGFNVNEEEATSLFFPTYFKRLYWVGHPVLERQESAQGYAHTIGVAWGGNAGLGPLSRIFFPEDEFHALQTGVPLSRYLTEDLPASTNGRKPFIEVIAHSLGNMAVNSALTLMPPFTIDRYVMNEAAVPAEAFDANYQYSPTEMTNMFPHARDYGYSDAAGVPQDARWQADWLNMQSGLPYKPNAVTGLLEPDLTDLQEWNAQIESNAELVPRPLYDVRWTQERPVETPDALFPVPPLDLSGTTPRRGPWRGFFAGNRARTTILNTWNGTDQALRIDDGFAQYQGLLGLPPELFPTNFRLYVWYLCQTLQKPTVRGGLDLGLGLRPDNRSVQFWARLKDANSLEEYTWSGGNHANITRQWAELAYWFPALSGAAGATPIAVLQNQPFRQYGGDDSANAEYASFTSHTYMTTKAFHEVWGAYGRLRDFLADQ